MFEEPVEIRVRLPCIGSAVSYHVAHAVEPTAWAGAFFPRSVFNLLTKGTEERGGNCAQGKDF